MIALLILTMSLLGCLWVLFHYIEMKFHQVKTDTIQTTWCHLNSRRIIRKHPIFQLWAFVGVSNSYEYFLKNISWKWRWSRPKWKEWLNLLSLLIFPWSWNKFQYSDNLNSIRAVFVSKYSASNYFLLLQFDEC